MIVIPLLQYCVDVKSKHGTLSLFQSERFQIPGGAAIVSLFDGTSWVCQLGGVSSLRRVVDELKRTNQEGPRLSSTKSVKRAAEHGVAATVGK